MPTIHLPYGGSTAHRTIGCPGWLKKSDGIPKHPAGDATIEGSMHHTVMERCQRDGITPGDVLVEGLAYEEADVKRVFTEDDLDLSNIAFNATNELLDKLDIDEMMIEPFVQLVPGVAGGSIDLLGLSADRKTLLVLDYKFGQVKVEAKESPNLALYGCSAWTDSSTADLFEKVEKVVFAIVQPRAKGVVFTWKTDLAWLTKFTAKFIIAMDSTNINPGPHCKYCPAEPYCQEKRATVIGANLLGARLQEELQAGADIVEEVEAWVRAMHEEMYLQMNRGVPVKGWKIVDKKPSTKWTNADGAAAFLKSKRIARRDIIKPAALMTPIQVGKILHKKGKDNIDLSEFTVTESSGTTLAPESDNRDAVIASDVQGHLKDIVK